MTPNNSHTTPAKPDIDHPSLFKEGPRVVNTHEVEQKIRGIYNWNNLEHPLPTGRNQSSLLAKEGTREVIRGTQLEQNGTIIKYYQLMHDK